MSDTMVDEQSSCDTQQNTESGASVSSKKSAKHCNATAAGGADRLGMVNPVDCSISSLRGRDNGSSMSSAASLQRLSTPSGDFSDLSNPSSDAGSQSQSALKNEDKDDSDESARAKEKRRRQKLPDKQHMFCEVCGDKSNGYNFGALTCESCKAFFRRNALKTKETTCNFENDCKIDPFTRKFCTACRLKKCFSINMKKEWILDEDALKKRKRLTRKAKEEKAKEGQSGKPNADSTSAVRGSADEHPDNPPEPLSEEDQIEINEILENHRVIDLPLPNARKNKFQVGSSNGAGQLPPGMMAQGMMPTGMLPHGMMPQGMMPPGMSHAKHPGMPQHRSSSSSSAEFEQRDVNDRGFKIDADEYERLTDQATSPTQMINMVNSFVYRFIPFIKTLPAYRNLDLEDQICLLKQSIMETLALRSALQYDPTIDGFSVEEDETGQKKNLGLSFIKLGFGEELYEEHMKFITSFNTAAKWDKPTMILVMIINLFASDRPGLKNKALVAAAEEKYSLLLQAYLRSKYTLYEARHIYPKLLLKLTDVRSYGEMSRNIINSHNFSSNDQDLEPLLKEIFNNPAF